MDRHFAHSSDTGRRTSSAAGGSADSLRLATGGAGRPPRRGPPAWSSADRPGSADTGSPCRAGSERRPVARGGRASSAGGRRRRWLARGRRVRRLVRRWWRSTGTYVERRRRRRRRQSRWRDRRTSPSPPLVHGDVGLNHSTSGTSLSLKHAHVAAIQWVTSLFG